MDICNSNELKKTCPICWELIGIEIKAATPGGWVGLKGLLPLAGTTVALFSFIESMKSLTLQNLSLVVGLQDLLDVTSQLAKCYDDIFENHCSLR